MAGMMIADLPGHTILARCDDVYDGETAVFTFKHDDQVSSYACKMYGYKAIGCMSGDSFIDKRRAHAARRTLRALILGRQVALYVVEIGPDTCPVVIVRCGGVNVNQVMINGGYGQ